MRASLLAIPSAVATAVACASPTPPGEAEPTSVAADQVVVPEPQTAPPRDAQEIARRPDEPAPMPRPDPTSLSLCWAECEREARVCDRIAGSDAARLSDCSARRLQCRSDCESGRRR